MRPLSVSLSSSDSASVAELMATHGLLVRILLRCMARATNFLAVPLSPETAAESIFATRLMN